MALTLACSYARQSVVGRSFYVFSALPPSGDGSYIGKAARIDKVKTRANRVLQARWQRSYRVKGFNHE